MARILVTLLICFTISVGWASAAIKPLPVNAAFELTPYLDQNHQLVLQWDIAPGYYLYREQVYIEPNKNQVELGALHFPEGVERRDDLHGLYQAYFDKLVVYVPLLGSLNQILDVNIHYQGCSSQGFCYPPVKKTLKVNLASVKSPRDLSDYLASAGNKLPSSHLVDQSYAADLLQGQHLFFIILSFLGLGLLLAFTPCVLPMIPILSSIIVGFDKEMSTYKAFRLSLSYVMGMALTYAATGMAVALLGSSIQVAMQKPSVIVSFSLLFVALALSLFGFYELKLPNRWQRHIVSWSHKHEGGTYVGVFFMGVLSTLIVSPCVSAPLVGALTYIAETGNVALGGLALLSMGIGMGIPLLLIGTTAGKLLPKAGQWMEIVKKLFGILMLAMAILMIERIASGAVILVLWAVLLFVTTLVLWQMTHSKRFLMHLNRGFGVALMTYSGILMVGAFLGNTDPFYPLANQGMPVALLSQQFTVVKNVDELNVQLQLAKKNKKNVLLDFYADWCVSCIVMDKKVFNQVAIKDSLTDYVLLRVNVTKNSASDRALLSRFNIIAPPSIIFFNASGALLTHQQIVGEVNAKEFLAELSQIKALQEPYLCDNKTSSC